MKKVRCNNCMEIFDEKELVYDGEEEMDFCPYCGEGGKAFFGNGDCFVYVETIK